MISAAEYVYRRIATSVGRTPSGIVLQPWCPSGTAVEFAVSADRNAAEARITSYIYANYYAFHPALFDADAGDPLIACGIRHADPVFWNELCAANPGDGYFDPGWKVQARLPDGELRVEKEGISLIIKAWYHLLPSQRVARVSDEVSVRFPKDAALAAPGFYVAYANSGPAGGTRQARIYLNLQACFAAQATYGLLRRLLDVGVPFTFKVLADPAGFCRRDNTVVYVGRPDFSVVANIVSAYRAEFDEAFCESVPSFVKPLWPGVGVADNPQATETRQQQSFGQHRSMWIAQAICDLVINTEDKRHLDAEAVYKAIIARLEAERIDPARPYLNSADAEEYELI